MVIRVLFADQSATIQKLAAQAFAQEKIEVIKVGNGDLAAWLLDEINADVVIADVSLPDRDGYELCHLIKDNPRLSHIPVLLLCWSDESFDHAKANSARADAYLTKPFESRALVENVRRLLQERDEARGASAPAHAADHIEEDEGESFGPPVAANLFEEASVSPPSRPVHSEVDSEAEISPLTEEPLPASEGPPEGRLIPEPPADEEAPARTAAAAGVKGPGAVSYSAPHGQALTNPQADPELISQRPGKALLVWAVLAIIAFSAILGIWQARRVGRTQLAGAMNANASEVDQQSVNQQSSDQQSPDQKPADQQPQGDSELSSDTRPEPPPQSDSPESKVFDKGEEPAERPSPNLRGDARVGNPRASSPEAKITPFTNPYQQQRANNFNAANSNRSPNSNGRISPQAKPSEPNRASMTAAKNNNSGPSPVRIIPGNAATSVATGRAQSESAMKPVVDQPNGFQQIGNGVKGAVTWTGRKAGQGIKAVARALKRAFSQNPKID